ncbi:MAG: MnhB domain-containing protein [Chloroflexi bacterium]|nr:MnhB domain-containing protein [Chloroflexota bacterium]
MHSESNSFGGMSLIVKTVTGWLAALITVFGIYVVLYGHETPGGGFAGGVSIASGFILITLAFGQKTALRVLGERTAALLSGTGILVFLGLAVSGLLVSNAFFGSFIAPSDSGHGLLCSLFILLCEIGVALVVAMSIYHVFTVLSRKRTDSNEK